MLSRRMLRRYFDRRWCASRYGRKWPARVFPRWYHRSGRHPDVIHERHARLEKFFGGELPVAVRDSLSGHVALVSQLASAGARLAVDHETARCEIAMRETALSTKVVLTGIGRLDDIGIRTPVHAERFVTMPQLPPGRLEYLLARARFLAYASFNEGFGYPPIEAMSRGTPSLIADNTSLPEVGGAAAVRCDPFDLDSITTGIRTILTAPPAPAAIQMQVAETNVRQRRDVEALADLICSRVAAGVDSCTDCEADGAATTSGVSLAGIASIR